MKHHEVTNSLEIVVVVPDIFVQNNNFISYACHHYFFFCCPKILIRTLEATISTHVTVNTQLGTLKQIKIQIKRFDALKLHSTTHYY